MKLITETTHDLKYLAEETAGGKNYRIEGVFMQANTKNRNGRIYESNILNKEVGRYLKEYVQNNRAMGELGHPEGPTLNLERVSHLITDLKINGNDVIGTAKVLGTPYGKIVENLGEIAAEIGGFDYKWNQKVERKHISKNAFKKAIKEFKKAAHLDFD